MKKNGFTLLELLAVILILGVISLIAIPTITSIIEDSKKQSYIRSAEGLLSSISNECNIKMIKGNSVYEAYNFDKNKLLNTELELKGELPKEGHVRINDDCEILMAIVYDHYCLTKEFKNEKITVNEIENSKCNLPGTKNKLKSHIYYSGELGTYTYDKTEYMDDPYREKIISINYLYSSIVPSNIAGGIVWDLSKDQNESIKGYLLANEDNYDLYIISKNTIAYDISSRSIRFSFLPNLENVNFYNFNTTGITSFREMFNNYKGIKLDLTGFDTSSATNMYEMFANAKKLEELNISNFNTSKVTNMTAIFYGCQNLSKLDVTSFETSRINNMRRFFGNCKKLKELDLSNFDTNNVTNMSQMFNNTPLLTKIYIGNSWVNNASDITDMCSNSGSNAGDTTCNFILKN